MLQLIRTDVIGRGPVSVVFSGTFGTQPAAVKRFLLHDVHPDWKNKVDECFEKMLVHPNVVSVKSVHDDDDFRYVVMERCLANLSDYCRNEYDGPVSSHHDGLVQLVSGLNYIHSQGFIHRRLNTPNILISSSQQFKIADFGMTDCKSEGSTSLSTIKQRSASTEAPELLQLLELSEGEKELHHTTASDTFSLGCILALFFTRGSHPFGSPRFRVPVNIIQNNYNFQADMPYTHIVDQMIKKLPQKRIPLDKILSMLKV